MAVKNESENLLALTNFWKLTPKRDRQELIDTLSDDCQHPCTPHEQFAGPKRVWMKLSSRERETWRQWVDSQ